MSKSRATASQVDTKSANRLQCSKVISVRLCDVCVFVCLFVCLIGGGVYIIVIVKAKYPLAKLEYHDLKSIS